jgi:hypothetical protein
MHRRRTGPVVADRHHRAPDHRWQAVAVRDHRRLHQPDPRVLDGRPYDRPPRRRRAHQRRRAATPLWDGGALRPQPASSAPTPTSAPSAAPACTAQWDASAPAPTTPPWSHSSACYRKTS